METFELKVKSETYVMNLHRLVFGEMTNGMPINGEPALIIRVEDSSGNVLGHLKHTMCDRIGDLRFLQPDGRYNLYIRQVRK